MKITSIKPRRDGKFLVGLHFSMGTNLRKVMTAEQVQATKAQVDAERALEVAYRAGKE